MVAAKGPLAPPTAVPLRLPTVDHDIPSANDTALRTGRGVAELLPRVHARLQVTGCSGCVTRNARWTRLLSIPPPPQRCSTVEWGATVYLDSAAYREFTGGAPAWSSYARYCEAIDLVRPNGAMAKDTVGDQDASRRGYERMCADGYDGITIPVWQTMPCWVSGLSVEANALLAARDSVLRFYCDRALLVAIGGLNQSPCRRAERPRYLEVLCRAFPDTRFWGLGQANPVVVNGLGCAGLLDRVWVDGSWWIHDARTEVLAVLEDGLIKTIRLTRTGARSFFPLLDLMSCNLACRHPTGDPRPLRTVAAGARRGRE